MLSNVKQTNHDIIYFMNQIPSKIVSDYTTTRYTTYPNPIPHIVSKLLADPTGGGGTGSARQGGLESGQFNGNLTVTKWGITVDGDVTAVKW